ncbi:MAG: hypothetical protein ACP6IS_07820 [Candidatus Asgardarchaeia archaeon]
MMLFLYFFASSIAMLVPLLAEIKMFKSQFGILKILLSWFEYIVINISFFYYYIQVIVIGGETYVNPAVILTRIGFAMRWAIIVILILVALKIFNRKLHQINYEDADIITLTIVTMIINILYFIIYGNFDYASPTNYPPTLAVPWYTVIVDNAVLFAVIAILFSTVYLFIIRQIETENADNILLNLFSRLTVWHHLFGFALLTLLFSSLSIGIIGATMIGYPILLTLAIITLFFFFMALRANRINIRHLPYKELLIIAIIVSSVFLITVYPFKIKGEIDDGWNNNIGFNICTNTSEFPIDLYNVRLVDRYLARDFAASYRLPKIGDYQLRVDYSYENIGLINDKPAWILPVYYTMALTPEINYMVGYLYIHLDTPTFESMKFVQKVMTIAPGLYGSHDIFFFTMNIVPDGIIGEIYLIDPSPVTSSPAWVVLIDKYSPWNVELPYKVLIVGAKGDYKLYNWRDAVNIVPQVVSRYSLESIVKTIGGTMRNGEKAYFAHGFVWIPPSQDVQEYLESTFYHRAHHFLIGDYWGRDFYMAVRTSGGEESVAAWILLNDTLTLYDLRFYRGIGGVVHGVNSPDRAIDTMLSIISESVPTSAIIRYPKLYRVDLNTTYLVWVALVVQVLSGADKPLGVVWVDASNTRIAGFVQYVYGESHEVFMGRLYENIEASYKGWTGENASTLTTAIINGTVIRKNWALLKPDNTYAIVMSILNNTGEILTVLVLEEKVATKQDFYNAVLAKENDRVFISARWDIDLQAWVAYTIELYPTNSSATT